MEYSEENSSTLPEYHSSLTVLHQLDEFWFYGNILKDDINPKLCLSSAGISPYRSIEMVEKKKLLCGDDSEEERRKKKDREEDEEPIASSSASNLSFSLNFNKNLPCSRFASLIPLSESEANKEEDCHMQKPSSSSSSSATTTSIQHCPNVIISQREGTKAITMDPEKTSIRIAKQARSSRVGREELPPSGDRRRMKWIMKDKRKSSKSMTSLDFDELQARGFNFGKEDCGSYPNLKYYILPEVAGPGPISSSTAHLRWHVPVTAEGRADMKEHLKFWARAVASTVR